MKAENGCREELRQGYCSFPLHLLSKGVVNLLRGEDFWGVKHDWSCLFKSTTVQTEVCSIYRFVHSVLIKAVLPWCMSNQRLSFNFIQTTRLCFWTSVRSRHRMSQSSLPDDLFEQIKASESPWSISILASSSVSGVTASWGKGIIEIRPPPALCLWPSQPSQPSQFFKPPGALQSSPLGAQRAKRHQGPL